MSDLTLAPGDPEGLDPAATGDPFVRMRYRFGMLLGAEEFTLEQRSHLLRGRLHQALLHGGGIVCGLGVGTDADAPRELRVAPGYAVDALGREICVPQRLCLDVSGLHRHAIWDGLPSRGEARRVFVVLRYRACESQPVPAIQEPCAEPADAPAYSRVLDSYRVDLEATAPRPPHEQLLRWIRTETTLPALDDADAVRAYLAGPADGLAALWTETEAPLLLGAVDLVLADDQVRVARIDLDGRVVLDPTWLLGRGSGGGPSPAEPPSDALRVVSVALERGEGSVSVRVTTNRPVDPATVVTGVTLARLCPAGWTTLSPEVHLEGEGTEIVITPAETDLAGSRFQLVLHGAGSAPLLSTGGAPLSGWKDEAPRPAGRGVDVAYTGTWEGAWATA